jgi:hypothetical protein
MQHKISRQRKKKNAIYAAKNRFSKVEYLKNLFQYNSVFARIRELSGWAVR